MKVEDEQHSYSLRIESNDYDQAPYQTNLRRENAWTFDESFHVWHY